MTDQDTGAAPQGQVRYTADLLRSLQETLHHLRNEAEELRRQLQAGEAADSPAAKSQVGKIDPLIRDCQKVEKLLAEQSAEFARLYTSEAELDLDAARREIDGRLDRLRAALCADGAAG